MCSTKSRTARLLGCHLLTKELCSRFRVGLSTTPMTTSKVQHYATEATFDIQPYKLFTLDKGPPVKSTINTEKALKLYKEMQYSRRIEAAVATLYKEKKIRGFCHLYSGQEAVAVGMKEVMQPQDTAITSYRCHTWTYLMGATPLAVISELTGRRTGCVRGKGGSMHMYAKQFYGGNGIVGAQVPLGAGVGFMHKYKGDGGVCFALYGDGAANQGQVYEAFNMAKLWNLPVAFVCENNKYGLGTSAQRSSASTDYYKRAQYIPGLWIDGMDVFACMEGTRFAIEWVKSGKGPIVLEMETYRYFGHSMSDPGTSYRTREEVQTVRKTRDPITTYKAKILDKKLVTPEQLKEIDGSSNKVVSAALAKARSETEVGLEELSADIYVECIETQVRGVIPSKPLTHSSIAKR